MHWIAPSEKNADNAALEKRLCDAAMRDNASNPTNLTPLMESGPPLSFSRNKS